MKAYLLTADGCTPCTEMKEQLKVPLEKGEISELSFETNPDQVTEFISKFQADIPGVVVVSDDGQLLAKG